MGQCFNSHSPKSTHHEASDAATSCGLVDGQTAKFEDATKIANSDHLQQVPLCSNDEGEDSMAWLDGMIAGSDNHKVP